MTDDYLTWSREWATLAHESTMRPRNIEKRLVRMFRRLCRRIEPTLVLEIGAHEATLSQWAADTFPEADVKAFEANPYVHAKYAAELAETRVDYRNLAVGRVNGDVQLNVPTEVWGRERELTNRMASLGHQTGATDDIQVTVPSVRLDDYLSLSHADRVVAWIDVEGSNEIVLSGGGAVLDQTQAVFIEVESKPLWEGQWLDREVAEFLGDHGLLPVARDIFKPRRNQYNVVFARAEHAHDPRTGRQAASVLEAARRG
ncbi:MAG: FkbM family methyltransferase [Nocardioides sp.]